MATKSSTKNKSTLTGTSVADILTVKHDQVTVNGADGNDTIKITKGNSSKVSGGVGADTITVSVGKSHVIHGNAGNDTITIGKSAGTGIKVYGDAGNDTIKATNSYAVTFYGGDGNDTLTGGKGADKLYGDAGTDKLYGGAGNDTLSGGAGNDTLNGQAGNDTLTGGAGKDTFVYTNGGGSDKITDYAPGYDTLQISSGSISKTTLANSSKDLVFTVGTGKVTLINAAAKTISLKDSRGSYTASKTAITLGSNFRGTMDVAKYLGTVTTVNGKSTTKTVTVKGNAKANTLYGGSGANTLYGYAGNDKLYGYAGNDILYGGDGDDTLNGGDGNDTLYGGAGADTLTGGAGKDTFVYVNGEGNDTITDYASGQDALQIANGSVSNMALANNNKDLVFTVGDGSVTVKDAAAKSVRMQDSRGSYTVTRRTITLGSDFTGTLDAAEVMPTVTTINGEAATGNTIIKGNGNNRSIYGGMGQDQLSAEGNNNALYGGVGDDILEVVKGTGNYLSGDEGNDEYIVNWPLREEPNSGDEHHTVVIDNAFAEESDSDTLVINGADSSNFTFSLSADDARNLVIREEASGDYVVVYDWVNHGFESVTFDDKAFTNDEIREIIAEASRTKVDWHLGDTVALAASEIGTGLQINGYKENDFVVTLDSNGQLVMRDAQGGTLTISNWDENTLEAVAFAVGGYKKIFTAEEFSDGIFTTIALANEEGQELVYDSGSDVSEEFDINFTTSTNIVINSANGSEDRIKFTDNHSVDNVDIQIKDNDLYLYNWDPQAKQRIDGQVVIKGIKNSTVKTIEFGEMTYHLIGEETKTFVGSDTVTDRYLFLDTGWNGTDTIVPNWEVTIDGINGQDVLDFHFLPNNSRYYDLSGQADGNDMVLTYRYSIDKVNGATLGTVRLKNFYNDDGTINTANGYPMIRTNREIYAGDVSDSAWDSWKWILDKNYRWLSMNAGTAGDDVIDLRNETRPTDTKAWLFYAGSGNDTVTSQAGDIVYGGTGDDTINVMGSVSDVHGGAGVDTIVVRGADGQNLLDHVVVRADAGNDIINAYGSYHYINGGSGDDEIHIYSDENGGEISHNNAVSGKAGKDTIYIHVGHDHIVNGGGDDDIIYVEGGNNNRLNGGDGNDVFTVNGGTGNTLRGGAGNDTFTVNGGNNNTLYGGIGSDTYIINTMSAADTNVNIYQEQKETEDNDADVLQLTQVNKGEVTYAVNDGTLTITHSNGGKVSINGWDANPLAEIQFADNQVMTGAAINELLTAPEVVTQQSVIRNFMKSLDENPTLINASVGKNATQDEIDAAIAVARNDASAVLDTAVNYASNGKFATWDALVESFVSDVRNHGNKDNVTADDFTYDGVDAYGHAMNIVPESGLDRFLKNYCGIDLTNEDTGSIIGADAGGAEVKTAVSIVPENGTVMELMSPGTDQTTINGLTFHWPDTADDPTKQYIVDSLYTWWAKEGLNLVEEAFGVNFMEDGVTGRDMTVEFVETDDNFLAKVETHYSYQYTMSGEEMNFTSETTTLNMKINMKYFNSVDTTSIDGYTPASNSYLDRTIAHEFTHAVMGATMARVYAGGWLPLYVTEGLAELVHGIDDFRTTDIIGLASSDKADYLAQVLQPNIDAQSNSYAAGYMLFRYLAKQVADSFNENTSVISSPMLANFGNDALYTFSSDSGAAVNGVSLTDSGLSSSSLVVASSNYATDEVANMTHFSSDKKGLNFT